MKLRDYQQKAVVAIFESRRPGERDDWRMSEKPSSVLALIDYRTVCQYAASCCHRKHVRACDVEDIAHAAWIDCQRRGRSAVGEENPAALARRIMFTSIQDAIRRWRGTYEHEAPVLDVPTVDGRRVVTAADLSDRGAGAERELLAADDWENPFWLRLFEATHFQLRADARKKVVSPLTVKAIGYLLTDSRLAVAREKLGISHPTFRRILEILKVRFALCFQAYEAYQRFKTTFTF